MCVLHEGEETEGSAQGTILQSCFAWGMILEGMVEGSVNDGVSEGSVDDGFAEGVTHFLY